nr:MAG: hypothetical protein [Helarchaeota virus Nidhogg Meg22_1012]
MVAKNHSHPVHVSSPCKHRTGARRHAVSGHARRHDDAVHGQGNVVAGIHLQKIFKDDARVFSADQKIVSRHELHVHNKGYWRWNNRDESDARHPENTRAVEVHGGNGVIKTDPLLVINFMDCYHVNLDDIKKIVDVCERKFDSVRDFVRRAREWVKPLRMKLLLYEPDDGEKLHAVTHENMCLVSGEKLDDVQCNLSMRLLRALCKKYQELLENFFSAIREYLRDTNYGFIQKDSGLGMILLRISRNIAVIAEPKIELKGGLIPLSGSSI